MAAGGRITPRRRRVLKWLLAALLLVLLIPASAWLYLTSGPGAEQVRLRVLRIVNQDLQGKVEAKSLRSRGGLIVIEGLKLFTPEGELVAEIARAELDPQLLALSRGQVVLRSLKVDQPRFYLKSDERGLNLNRAVAAKLPLVPGAGAGSQLAVEIGEVAIGEGYLDFAFGETHYTVQQIQIDGKATVWLPKLGLVGDLHLGGQVTAPLVDVLSIDLAAITAQPGEGVMDLLARTSDTHVKGQLSFDPVKLVVTESLASPGAVRAFAPGFRLKVPISSRGTVSPAAVELSAEAGAARVTAKASFPERGGLEAVEVHATGIDLAELIEGGRRSQLAAHLTGRLEEAAPEKLQGALQGQARWDEDGKVLATADVDIIATGGKLEVKQLAAKVPGAALTVKGRADRQRLAIDGALEVSDLRGVARTIADFTGGELLPLSGRGSLKLASAGPLLHPALSLEGGFGQLRFDDVRLEGLKLNLQLADVRRFLETQAQLTVDRLQVGQTVLEGLRAETTSRGRALTARLSTRGLQTLALSALLEGTLDPDNQGLQLTGLTVEYPPVKWTLEAPAHLGWTGEGDFSAEPVALRAGEQRVVVEASRQRQQLLATAQLQRVDLAQLPRALVPAALRLGGQVDAKARAWGPGGKLQSELELAWRGGTFQGLSEIGLTARARTAQGRVDGTLAAGTSIGEAEASFSVPLARQPGKEQPVTVRLSTSAVELSKAALAFGRQLPVDGAVTTRLALDGTLEQPRPSLQLESANLRICDGPCARNGRATVAATRLQLDRVALSLAADPEHRPVVTLAVNGLGGLTEAKLKIPLTFAQLGQAYWPAAPRRGRAPPPKGVDWPLTPLELELKSTGIELEQLGPVVQLTRPLKGTIRLAARGTGSLRQPNLEATVGVSGLQGAGLLPLELSTTLTTNRDDTRVQLELRRLERPVLALTGRMGGPLERLQTEAELLQTGLLIDAELGPVGMGELFVQAEDEPAPPSGTLRAQLSVRGTAAAPKASMRGSLQSLKVASVALGQANLTWDYEGRRHVFATTLNSGGKLTARGELELDVSVPALRKGLAAGKAPLKATVAAKGFDLSFFSGAHPMVRTLGGLVKLDARIEGELANPGFEGMVEWTRGRLGVSGYGDYRDVYLLLRGNNAGYTLEQLTASAGGGSLALRGKAARERRGHFTLSGEGRLERFPIIADDQLAAIATARLSVAGEASARLINLQRLSIPEARIELPDVKRKDLQELARPADIVLVRNGVPVKKKKPKPDAAAIQASIDAARTFRVMIDAPRNLWVKSSDVNLELGLSENFRVEYTDRVLIYGEANVVRGRVDVLGRRFEMQKNSQVRFNGIANQPYLNVTAVHVNERENVTVFVNVIGKGKDASLKLTSQPPIPDSELLILVTTGRRTLKRGGGSSLSGADAASVLGSVVASQLKTLVAKRLPLDVLSIESGDTGIQDARVEAGVYLSDSAYLGLQIDLGADRSRGENAYAAKLEYQLSKLWSIEASAGDAPAAGASLLWSRDF